MGTPCWSNEGPGTRTLIAALLLVALGTLPASGEPRTPKADRVDDRDARRQEEEQRLARVRREIDELRRRLDQDETAAGSVLDALDELDMKAALLHRESESLRDEVRAAGERERAARRDVESLELRLDETETALRSYLRETYKIGPARDLRVVAAAASPAQVAAGYRAIEAMSLGEAARIESYRADRERLSASLAELQSEEERLLDLQSTLREKTGGLEQVRGQKSSVLADLRRRQASQKALLQDLVDMEGQIQLLLTRLALPAPEGPVPSLGFDRSRGQLEWPARGRVAVPFGNVRHPRFNTVVPHPGIDIASAPGQAVRAVFDGRVVFSDWFKGYGQMIVIDHGDAYLSIYGHVDERLVSASQEVSRGDVIARSGQGGAFEDSGLYFEIRHDGKPEDPVRWLKGGPGTLTGHVRETTRGHHAAHGAP